MIAIRVVPKYQNEQNRSNNFIMKTTIKIIIIALVAILPVISWGQSKKVTEIELQRQPDNRIYIKLGYETESSFGTQHAGVYVENKTNDRLGIKIKVNLHLTCGSTYSYNVGVGGEGIILLGGKTTDPSFFFDANYMSRDAIEQYLKLCGKRKEGQKTVISGVSCQLLNIINYSQNERDEKAKRDKEEAERKRLTEEKSAKAKQEVEQKRLAEENAKKETKNKSTETVKARANLDLAKKNTESMVADKEKSVDNKNGKSSAPTIPKEAKENTDSSTTSQWGAYVAPGVWKEFMRENIGGDNAFYTGEQAQNACPPGWRLPTRKEWEGLVKNNTYTFANGIIKIGDNLTLPASGFSNSDIPPSNRSGYYWSETASYVTKRGSHTYMSLSSSLRNTGITGTSNKDAGFCVRCIKD